MGDLVTVWTHSDIDLASRFWRRKLERSIGRLKRVCWKVLGSRKRTSEASGTSEASESDGQNLLHKKHLEHLEGNAGREQLEKEISEREYWNSLKKEILERFWKRQCEHKLIPAA